MVLAFARDLLGEKTTEHPFQAIQCFGLAFPNDQNIPARVSEESGVTLVSQAI